MKSRESKTMIPVATYLEAILKALLEHYSTDLLTSRGPALLT
jgi:hypothetical protein